jgi:uncharacterized membrane protein
MARKLALSLVFCWFFFGGLAHFVFTDAEIRIVPPSLPEPRLLVWVSGVLELIGAGALLWVRSRRYAGWLLILLTIAVTPANIYMLMHSTLFPEIPHWVLVARLPLQLGLLACIGWVSQERAPVGASRSHD